MMAVPLAVFVSRLLYRMRPAWSGARIALLSSLPGGVIILLLGGYLLARVGPAAPGEIDSGGMIIVALITLTPAYALLVAAVGAVSALTALRRAAKQRANLERR